MRDGSGFGSCTPDHRPAARIAGYTVLTWDRKDLADQRGLDTDVDGPFFEGDLGSESRREAVWT